MSIFDSEKLKDDAMMHILEVLSGMKYFSNDPNNLSYRVSGLSIPVTATEVFDVTGPQIIFLVSESSNDINVIGNKIFVNASVATDETMDKLHQEVVKQANGKAIMAVLGYFNEIGINTNILDGCDSDTRKLVNDFLEKLESKLM